MALSILTAEQRSANLVKALTARTARAEMMASLKRGEATLAQVLTADATDHVLANTKVLTLLQALPMVGKTKAAAAMTAIGIAPPDGSGASAHARRRSCSSGSPTHADRQPSTAMP